MAKKTARPPEWKEVDPKVVIGEPAGKIYEYLYKRTVWTVQRIAGETSIPPEIVKEQLDELVKIGKMDYLEKSLYNEPAYAINYEQTEEEKKSAKDCRNKIGETAGKIWHCLGAEGKTAKQCPIIEDQIEKRIGASHEYTCMGIGWLAAEGKLRMFENAAATGSKKYAYCLTDAEQAIYNGLKKD